MTASREDRRVPSEAYREQFRRELLNDPEVARELREFREFVAKGTAIRALTAERDALAAENERKDVLLARAREALDEAVELLDGEAKTYACALYGRLIEEHPMLATEISDYGTLADGTIARGRALLRDLDALHPSDQEAEK